MEKKKVLDKRLVKLENVLKGDYIPFLGGRPNRTTVISEDDIVNLRINLNIARNVDEFVALM